MNKILIVEDELIVARDIRHTLERNGYKVAGVVRSAEKALTLIQEDRPSFVLVDIFLKGDLTGIDLAIQLNRLSIPFIYISANSNAPVLEAAKKTDPYGFIVKPFREKDLLVTLEIARYRHDQIRQMQTQTPPPGSASPESMQSVPASTQSSPAPASPSAPASSPRDLPDPRPRTRSKPSVCETIIGYSSGMLRVFNLVQQVAPFDTSVLLLGESGTGKEGIADCIFRQSRRSARPFIKLNCAAIPSGLMESEFFGYEKGAFTGAFDRKAGKFEQAANGTILLDEIGEMPLEMQVKLLRTLQEKEIQRIGGSTTVRTDVRVIAATSRNLEKEVAEGRFRLDLYYRLQVFPITIPPLRQRKDDIPLLVDHFVQYYARKTGKEIRGVDSAVIDSLLGYSWPGNVRELQHLVERSVLLAQDDRIHEMPLPRDPAALIKIQQP